MKKSKAENKPRISLKLHGHNIQEISNYISLGRHITNDVRCEAEIKRRKAMAWNTFVTMNIIKDLFSDI